MSPNTPLKNVSRSIAVLPFANMSNKEESAHFADGITEEIINALTRIPELKVTSRTSSFFYKGKNIPIPDIGKQLGVALILEGSIRFSKNTIRITAQLIDAEEDFHFWSDTWDRSWEDIFEVQDEISLMIAEKAREFLGHFNLQEHLVHTQTPKLHAYEWYLKGRYFFRQWNPEQAKEAINCYDRALAIDPRHAESLIGKADALGFLATTGFISQYEAWEENHRLITTALDINPNLAEGYYLLSNYYFFAKCDFKAAMESALRAKELNTNHPETNQHLSFLYILAGNASESEMYLKHCLTVDPLSQETRFFNAYFNYMAENYADALAELSEILAENPHNVPAHSVSCYCLLKQGQFEEALHFFEKVPKESTVEEDKLGIQTLAHIHLNNEEQAKAFIEELEKRAKTIEGFRADSFLLFVYAALNQLEKVYDWVESAIQKKSPLLLIQLNDPLLGKVKQEKRYGAYLAEVYDMPKPLKESSTKMLLEPDQIEDFSHRLQQFMQEEKPYLDPDLSLKLLASHMNIHPNKLSWLINHQFQKNFNQYINSFRIETFKALAARPENKQYSILGLAFESGFNSKTVFNTYFKKETGCSPKAWLQDL